MRVPTLLLVVLAALALSCVALAAPTAPQPSSGHPPGQQGMDHHGRARRFVVFGWDLDRFLADLNRQVHRAWAASTLWARHLFRWSHRLPQHQTVYDLKLPGGGVGVVKIITFGAPHGTGAGHRGPLIWDGHKLSWKHPKAGDSSDGELLTFDHNGKHHAVTLKALAKYLGHAPAGSKVHAEVLGSSWNNLRIVLHVLGKHHKEDSKKSVSILVSKLIEKHSHSSHNKESHHKSSDSKESHHKLSHSKESHHKSSDSKESHHKLSHSKESHHKSSHSKESQSKNSHHKSSLAKESENSSSGEKSHASGRSVALESHTKEKHSSQENNKVSQKQKKSSSSSGLVWNGKSLSWADGVGADKKKQKAARRRQLRVTQDGVSHVIPLSVIAGHLGKVEAGSTIALEVVGKSLNKLEIVLHVHSKKGDNTVTLNAKELIKEADVLAREPGLAAGKVLPGPKTKHGKSIPLLGAALFSTTTPTYWV
ncbi:uncharacterized protein LOC113210165 [Frankliniella occidentalis]|uniref:Uncharacterized protein LOC113210165 n=1 Tax=Frankliniella occidentalis TaxID=133901 RepID=A0A6J1SSF9_FRAOC|nr:uncharacterized protein LOC113210165 [Frankliniella occidentalis]XP_052127704.1 uncharacterized protein LOC113210165 [Frankliniella occidentalis]